MMKKIGRQKALKLLEQNAVLIDVRDPVSFRDGTIPNAVNIVTRNMSSLMTWDKSTKLIFFGDGPNDPNLLTAINYAFQLKFEHIFYLENKDILQENST